LKIIFAGTPANAAFTLERLLQAGIDVVGVISRVDAAVGRKKAVVPSAVSELALRNSLDLYRTNRIDEETEDWIRSKNADLGVIVAYGSILREPVLSIPKLGWVNLHYSLLPEFPGPAPVQHALLSGKETTGVTLFVLDEGIDSGPIIARREVPIHENENAGELLQKLTEIGAELLLDVLSKSPGLLTAATAQPKGSSFAVAIKPTRRMAKLDFSNSATELANLVRAMNPEPMAWFATSDTEVRVLEAKPVPTSNLAEGLCAIEGKSVVVGTANAKGLELLRVQPAGKKPMAASDWFRGLRLDVVEIH
jgi:methionyl-tRNA formyltransferase